MVDYMGASGAAGVSWPYDTRFATASGSPGIQVQYNDGTSTRCDDAGWVDSPTDAKFANDPALAAQGIYTGVSRVRVLVHNRAAPYTSGPTTVRQGALYQRTTISIGMTVLSGTTPGTHLPTYTGYTSRIGDWSMAAMTTSGNAWITSDYDPAVNANPSSGLRLGDRLTYSAGTGRIAKRVVTLAGDVKTDEWVPASRTWRLVPGVTLPEYKAGDEMTFRLRPTLTADTTLSWQQNVRVEDCLPKDAIYAGSNVEPISVSRTRPAGASLACPDGQYYLIWDLGPRTINQPIPEITVTARVLGTAPNGIRQNRAIALADGDASSTDEKSDIAHVIYRSPDGLRVAKATDTPLVGVTDSGWANPARVVWSVTAANIGASAANQIGDLDMIDLLPQTAHDTSDFAGPGTFIRAHVSQGTGISIRYTRTARDLVNHDPADPSNGPTGSTVWCDAATGGTVTSGAGDPSACPQSAGEVTAIRILRPGPFLETDQFEVKVETLADLNDQNNLMENYIVARASGVTTALTPVSALSRFVRTTQVGTVRTTVWNDLNADGVRDPGEGPLAGVTVELVDPATPGRAPLVAVTDADGNVVWDGVPPGDYVVRIAAPGGMLLTTPAPNTVTVTVDGTAVVEEGFVQPGGILATAWDDANGDGVRTPDEGPLAGVRVDVTDPATGAVIATAVTGADGVARFDGLTPGRYTLVYTTPAGRIVTTPDANSVMVLAGQDTAWSEGFGSPPAAPAPVTPPPAATPPTVAPPTVASPTKTTLSVRIRPNRTVVRHGMTVLYRVSVTAGRATDARNVRVCVPVPAGLTLQRMTNARLHQGAVCWTIPTLRAGATRTFVLRTRMLVPRSRIVRTSATARASNVSRLARSTATVRVLRTPRVVPVPAVTG